MKIYIAYPSLKFKYVKVLKTRLEKELPSLFQFHLPPQLTSFVKTEMVFGDLEQLKTSDLLLCYIPEPSIGASMELMFFKQFHNHTRPAIGYQCLDHPFLNTFLDFKTDDYSELKKYLISFELYL